MTSKAQKVMGATMEFTLRPQQGDRAKVISAAIREIINQLQQSPGIISCADLIELCEELEKL